MQPALAHHRALALGPGPDRAGDLDVRLQGLLRPALTAQAEAEHGVRLQPGGHRRHCPVGQLDGALGPGDQPGGVPIDQVVQGQPVRDRRPGGAVVVTGPLPGALQQYLGLVAVAEHQLVIAEHRLPQRGCRGGFEFGDQRLHLEEVAVADRRVQAVDQAALGVGLGDRHPAGGQPGLTGLFPGSAAGAAGGPIVEFGGQLGIRTAGGQRALPQPRALVGEHPAGPDVQFALSGHPHRLVRRSAHQPRPETDQ